MVIKQLLLYISSIYNSSPEWFGNTPNVMKLAKFGNKHNIGIIIRYAILEKVLIYLGSLF